MSIIVNMFAGPGAGKSTTALGVTSILKHNGIDAEYVDEEAKRDAWEGTLDLTGAHQLTFTAAQVRAIDRLRGKVDFIVTDCPLLLQIPYLRQYMPEIGEAMATALNILHHRDMSINMFINRNKPFNQKGRNMDLLQSQKKDHEILRVLMEADLLNIVHTTSTNAVGDTIRQIQRGADKKIEFPRYE